MTTMSSSSGTPTATATAHAVAAPTATATSDGSARTGTGNGNDDLFVWYFRLETTTGQQQEEHHAAGTTTTTGTGTGTGTGTSTATTSSASEDVDLLGLDLATTTTSSNLRPSHSSSQNDHGESEGEDFGGCCWIPFDTHESMMLEDAFQNGLPSITIVNSTNPENDGNGNGNGNGSPQSGTRDDNTTIVVVVDFQTMTMELSASPTTTTTTHAPSQPPQPQQERRRIFPVQRRPQGEEGRMTNDIVIEEEGDSSSIPFVTATLVVDDDDDEEEEEDDTESDCTDDYEQQQQQGSNSTTTDADSDDTANIIWCWEETPNQMSGHAIDEIYRDDDDDDGGDGRQQDDDGDCDCCWIKYPYELSKEIERAYKKMNNIATKKTFRPSLLPGYELDFESMTQTKIVTGFKRSIVRHRHRHCHQTRSRGSASSAVSSHQQQYQQQYQHQQNSKNANNKRTSTTICWCWKETSHLMSSHSPTEVVGNPTDCWIRYDSKANQELENAYQDRKRCDSYSPLPGYVVYFDTMCQVKSSTGFQRDVQRLVLSSGKGNDRSGGNKPPEREGKTHKKCPYCPATIVFPETLPKTPYLYCCSCERTCVRDESSPYAAQMITSMSKWHICRYCRTYGEITSFQREVKYYTGDGEHRILDSIDLWRVNDCCRRCAKRVLYPSRHTYQPVNGQSCKGYQVSHCLRLFQKWNDKRYIGNKRGQRILKERVERVIQIALPQRHNAPELQYTLARSCLLRRDLDGTESAITNLLLNSCSNFMPAVNILEELLELRLKDEEQSLLDRTTYDDDDRYEHDDAVAATGRIDKLYQDFLSNVNYFRGGLDRRLRGGWYRPVPGCPNKTVKNIWQRDRRNDCAIS